MERRRLAVLAPERLMLGTVHLGFPYGIANRIGQPSYQEARGSIGRAAERGLAVFVRSIYLQGRLLMPVPEIPPELNRVRPTRQRLEVLAVEAGKGLSELAVR